MLPVEVLLARNALRTTLTHELAHVLIDPVLNARPAWVREGLAAVFSGETYDPVRADAGCPTDAEFLRPPDQSAMRDVYARAAACVRRELDGGQPWQLIGTGRN